MSIKINHNATKTVTVGYQFDFEAFVIELSVAIIFTVMSLGGYQNGFLLLWIPCAAAAAACYFAVFYSTYRYLADKLSSQPVNEKKR